MDTKMVAIMMVSFLALIAIAAPAHAWASWGSGWGGCCYNGWNSGWSGSSFAFASSGWHQPVNYHNQFITSSAVTPVRTFSSVEWSRSAHPMHFGYFGSGYWSW